MPQRLKEQAPNFHKFLTETLSAEGIVLLSWLISGAKQWAKASGLAEQMPSTPISGITKNGTKHRTN